MRAGRFYAPGVARGDLVVGVMPAARMAVVARTVSAVAAARGLRPVLREMWAGADDLARVRDGEVDVGVLIGPVATDGLHTRSLGDVARVAVLAAGSAWQRRGRIELADLLELPTFHRPEGIDPRWRSHWMLAHERRGEPRLTRSAPSTDTEALLTIAAGGGVGVAPATWLLDRPFAGCTAVPVAGLSPAPVLALAPAPPTRLQRDVLRALESAFRRRDIDAGPADALTPAERTVCSLLARGWSNRRIAEELHVSPRTVETQVSSALRKVGASGRTELAVRWARLSAE